MNALRYCYEVVKLITGYDEDRDGYERDKYLVTEELVDILLANGCLPELIEPTTTGILIAVSPQQVIDYLTKTLKEGRTKCLKAMTDETAEFKLAEHPRLTHLLLRNPGLAKLVKQIQLT